MCDTFVALGDATPSGAVLFAKNSDREPFEAQGLEWIPPQIHDSGTQVFATYLALPQVPRTRGVLLSRPYWMWGAEMGVNDVGVVAGNEAVFTRFAAARRKARELAEEPAPALLGMDVLRLCLERADTAESAAVLACELVESFGQGGEAGHQIRNFDYDNSFLFADRGAAWAVETAGSAWVRRRVGGIYAISNRLRIREDWDFASAHISAYARDAGLRPGRGRLDFARTFRDRAYEIAAMGGPRQSRSEDLLSVGRGALTASFAFDVLRDHAGGIPDANRPQICAHAGWLPQRRSAQSTGSLVVDFGQADVARAGFPLWTTASSAPCCSLFKPGWLDQGARPGWLPEFPGARADQSHWWRHQLLLKWARRDYKKFLAEIADAQRAFEARQLLELPRARGAAREERDSMSQQAWEAAAALEDAWLSWAEAQLKRERMGPNHRYLRNLERRANLR